MNKNTIKKIGCTILSGMVGVSMIPVQVYASEDNHPTKKSETIFTVLNGDGSVDSSIVSSWIHDDDGIQNIQEELQLKNVENVKTDEEPIRQGNTYTWNTKGNDVYYQGDNEQALPVSIEIHYTLDGKEIQAEDLMNKKGHLHVTMRCTPKVSRVVNGITIHPTYVFAGGIVLEDDSIQNVESENGKVIDDGNRKMFVFMTIPGLEQTLNDVGIHSIPISDTIEWEADINGFNQGDMIMAMSNELDVENLPSLPSLPSIQALLDADEQLVEGSKQLNEGSHALKAGIQPLVSIYPQIDDMKAGIAQLHQGSHMLDEGIQQYVQGVHQLNDGNQKLNGIVDGTQKIFEEENKLMLGAGQVEQGLKQLNEQVQAMDLNALKTVLAQMQTMVQTEQSRLDTMQSALQTVNEQMPALQQALQALNQQVQTMNAVVEQDNVSIQNIQNTMKEMQDSIDALDENDPLKNQFAILQTQVQALQAIPTMDFDLLVSGLQTSMQQLNDKMSASKQTVKEMEKDLKKAQLTLKVLEKTGKVDQLDALKQAVCQLYAGSSKVSAGTKKLNKALDQLQSQSQMGIEAVNQGSTLLCEKGDDLLGGSQQIVHGLDVFASKSNDLTDLQAGMLALDEAVDQLSQGSQALYDGQCKFSKEGISMLKEKFDLTNEQVDKLESVVRSIQQLNRDSQVFAGSPENAIHTSRFVFRMK